MEPVGVGTKSLLYGRVRLDLSKRAKDRTKHKNQEKVCTGEGNLPCEGVVS